MTDTHFVEIRRKGPANGFVWLESIRAAALSIYCRLPVPANMPTFPVHTTEHRLELYAFLTDRHYDLACAKFGLTRGDRRHLGTYLKKRINYNRSLWVKGMPEEDCL